MKKEGSRHHWGLLSLFALVVFLSLLISTVFTATMIFFLISNGLLILEDVTPADASRLLVYQILISVPVGICVALIASLVPLRPIRKLINSMDRLALGDFTARASVGRVMQLYPPYIGVVESFNKMAQQLENTELLRVDFVNNLSHEFKTPIVSIAGFAKLLKRGNLTREQQREYLDAIEEESMRLSHMATNVLNLSKVENQTILSDREVFNLSEQIRSCVLLLEDKWVKKDLDIQLDFAEYNIYANEELLRHVWINLLDNGVKFAPEGHLVQVKIQEEKDKLLVQVSNTGSHIPEEKRNRIFDKFYQADESHATHGNGVGLAIVKKIVSLHGGVIGVSSKDNVTAFTVELPKGSLS